MNLNKVFLIGRLTQDPEGRTIQSGQAVTTIRMATNRVWHDNATNQKKEATEYHTVVAWGRLAEIANQYLKRGGLVMIEGRLQTRSWQGQDGNKRYTTEIVADSLQMGPRSSGMGGEMPPMPSSEGPRRAPQAPTQTREPDIDQNIPIIDENELAHQGVEETEVEVKEEDLPF